MDQKGFACQGQGNPDPQCIHCGDLDKTAAGICLFHPCKLYFKGLMELHMIEKYINRCSSV